MTGSGTKNAEIRHGKDEVQNTRRKNHTPNTIENRRNYGLNLNLNRF